MRTPAAADALEFVWIVQMLPARLTFQVQATEMLSPSGSLVVVEAWRLSFVFGDAGLKVGAVAAGTRSHVTVLSVDVEALLPLPANPGRRSWTVNWTRGDRSDNGSPRAHAGDGHVVGRAVVRRDSLTAAESVPPAVLPVNETSQPVNPVTGSLKTAV